MSAQSNPNTHCYTYSYSHAYTNPDCNDNAHSYTQANPFTKNCSNAAAAPESATATVTWQGA